MEAKKTHSKKRKATDLSELFTVRVSRADLALLKQVAKQQSRYPKRVRGALAREALRRGLEIMKAEEVKKDEALTTM